MASTYISSWWLCIVFLIKKRNQPNNLKTDVVLSCTCHSLPTSEMANRDYIMMTCIKIKHEKFLTEKSIHKILLYCVKCTGSAKPDVELIWVLGLGC